MGFFANQKNHFEKCSRVSEGKANCQRDHLGTSFNHFVDRFFPTRSTCGVGEVSHIPSLHLMKALKEMPKMFAGVTSAAPSLFLKPHAYRQDTSDASWKIVFPRERASHRASKAPKQAGRVGLFCFCEYVGFV